MFVIFIPRNIRRHNKIMGWQIRSTFSAKAFWREIKNVYVVVFGRGRYCFACVWSCTIELATLIWDIINPWDTFIMIRFITRLCTRRPVSPPPSSLCLGFSFEDFLVAPDSSTCLRTVSGLFVGSRKSPNFPSKHERSSETFKIFQAILPLF